jgi:hypothetical protein
MTEIVKIITELGSFGLLLALAGFIVYSYIKNGGIGGQKTNMDEFKNIISANTAEIKADIKIIDNKVDMLENRIDRVEGKCNNDRKSHTKQFSDRIKLGPQIHKTLNNYRNRINADHIFIGSFHNGNESLTGIPYYKFDIIAERFRPDKVERDIEFAFMYKDADLLRHDLLPSEVVQRGVVHYIIKEDGSSELEDIDNIIYRRMIGRDIKQLAVSLLRDTSGTPSGFVGCVRYDYDELDIKELIECGRELEVDYANNEKLIFGNNKN